ncbi:MAG: TonB-dependent receptor [Bacteroidetes bacterium]|nr:TonB-dependent receptor [Bacteroidota bacterium]
MRQALETEQKALEINLDDSIYGTLAEIGAGQEVARNFFKVGASSGTIAKTMSAYDKVVSDEIYGPELHGRYVCESRLYKMLEHEWELIEGRLRNVRPQTNFFVFADTVATMNYQRTIKGDGWLGIRFQSTPTSEPNDLVLHIKLLDNDTQLQQQAVGKLGVNMVYACFRYASDPENLLISLMDGLHRRVNIDMVRLNGPDFASLDNRLLSLWLIKHRMSEVAMFGPDKRNVHPSEFLYKKHVLVVRASFRPLTLLEEDMIEKGFEQFLNEPEVEQEKSFTLTEITLGNLTENGPLDERDFLDRTELLCALGQTVIISSCEEYQQLISYFSDYKVSHLGLVLRAHRLSEFLSEKYRQNAEGSLLAAFGEVFAKGVRLYAYPSVLADNVTLMTAENLPIPDGAKYLYRHLLDHRLIMDIEEFNRGVMNIFASDVLADIRSGKEGWEAFVPDKVANLVKEKGLFKIP